MPKSSGKADRTVVLFTGRTPDPRKPLRTHAATVAPHKTNALPPVGLTEPQSEEQLPSVAPPPLRVVIVEDEVIISMELEMLLEELGAEVVGTAMSASQAEALVAQHRPDFLTMDINIKGDRDGVTAACDIFARFGTRSIFVSAFGDAATKARAAPANAIGWVRKPIVDADLADAVSLVTRRMD